MTKCHVFFCFKAAEIKGWLAWKMFAKHVYIADTFSGASGYFETQKRGLKAHVGSFRIMRDNWVCIYEFVLNQQRWSTYFSVGRFLLQEIPSTQMTLVVLGCFSVVRWHHYSYKAEKLGGFNLGFSGRWMTVLLSGNWKSLHLPPKCHTKWWLSR